MSASQPGRTGVRSIVALGDSLTQGFQHGAIRRPEWSFPAMLARSFGLSVGAQHRVPQFDGPGYPIDVEHMLNSFESQLGATIERRELLGQLPKLLAKYLDTIEDYYERGPGSKPLSFDGHYHNLAAWGFNVNEALCLTPAICAQQIEAAEGWVQDDLLSIPAMPMHRAAMRVFNPAQSPARAHATMIENLRALARQEPIDVLLVWLGANDCLDTVLTLELREMPAGYVGDDPIERMAFGLTSKAQFERDYRRMADEIAAILSTEGATNDGLRQVYVGNIPHVTIPPITLGIGEQVGNYFERYSRFFSTSGEGKSLSRAQAIHIDGRIDEFNYIIAQIVREHGWTLVDTASMLGQLSIKRNGCVDRPDAPLRSYLTQAGFADHPLLQLDPVPCISNYTVAVGPRGHRRIRGGLFGLDHVHPSTLGYGLVAERFLTDIKAQNPGDPAIQSAAIDWDAVLLADTLEQRPPVLWDDMSGKLEDTAWVWDLLLRAMIQMSS